jgi:hypothetical protein
MRRAPDSWAAEARPYAVPSIASAASGRDRKSGGAG